MQFLSDISPLMLARIQMAFTLAFHIIYASLGIGLPLMMLFAEWRHIKTGDPLWKETARRWARAFTVLFAVGAASGTVLSFELGLLWPGFMGTFGSAVGFMFSLEGFAFFAEAIFLGIYLYGWDRLSPRLHLLSGIPVALGGAFSGLIVTTANGFMNTPAGFTMKNGVVTDVRPWEAMFNPATATETIHTLVSAYMVAGLLVATVSAVSILRGRNSLFTRRAMWIGLALGLALAPLQGLVGDFSARMVARTQPAKLAAMEGQFKTEAGAPLRIGGIPDETARVTRWAIEIPYGLSLLAFHDPKAVITGLDDIPRGEAPPMAPVHISFQVMVACGTALILLGAFTVFYLFRFRRLPGSRLFLLAAAATGPLAVVATETGWMVTEIGRQPWIVRGYMKTADAVTASPGMGWLLLATVLVYGILAIGTIASLRHIARQPVKDDRA